MLFAVVPASVGCALFVMVIIGVIAAGVQVYLWVKHPHIAAQMSRQRHEWLMSWQQQRHEKEMQKETDRRERNRRAFGVAGTLFRLFLGHHH